MGKAIAVLLGAVCVASSANANDFRCMHEIDLPNSCSKQVAQFTSRIVAMTGWVEVGCLTSNGRKVSWTQPLYVYSAGEPLYVERSGTNTTSYPTYSWACPYPAMERAKQVESQKRKAE